MKYKLDTEKGFTMYSLKDLKGLGLTMTQKALYFEILALCKQEGYCWMTDAQFAELLEFNSKMGINKAIHKLEEVGLIKTKIIFNKEKNKVQRNIYPTAQDFLVEEDDGYYCHKYFENLNM